VVKTAETHADDGAKSIERKDVVKIGRTYLQDAVPLTVGQKCSGCAHQLRNALASLDAMVAAMAAFRGLAIALMKFANDMRWLASGPRCGLGELLLPENAPGLYRSCRARSTRGSAKQW
jgi:fumarate hydratase class II